MNRRRFIKNAAGLLVPLSFGIFIPTSRAQSRVYAVPGSLTVAYDNTTTALQNVTTNTVTFSHTVTGASPAITVHVPLIGTSQTVSGITYNSVALSLIGAANDTNGTAIRLEQWGLANCATGANNVVVTLSASNAAWDAVAISFSGVAASGAFDGFQSQGDAVGQTALSVNVTSASNNLVCASTCSSSDNGIAPAAGQTQRWLDNSGTTNTMGDHKAGAASVTMTENWSSTSKSKLMAAFNINHA